MHCTSQNFENESNEMNSNETKLNELKKKEMKLIIKILIDRCKDIVTNVRVAALKSSSLILQNQSFQSLLKEQTNGLNDKNEVNLNDLIYAASEIISLDSKSAVRKAAMKVYFYSFLFLFYFVSFNQFLQDE